MKEYNGGHEIYGLDEEGVLRKWYCYDDKDRKGINGAGLSFPDFLLVKYGENQEKGLIWDNRFEEWCNNNPNAPTSKFTLIFENLNPRPKDYPFKDWLLTKLADEYELGVGKKGHMLEDIWENCKKVQGDNTYWWHDQKLEEEERRKLGIDIKEYDPPMDLMDALPLGKENRSRFRDMIRKEVDSGRRIRRKTGFQPKFIPKLIQSLQQVQSSQNEPKIQKDYKTEYKKVKAKLALLEAKVSDDEGMTQVKVLMALADDELSVGKNHARNGEWIDITMRKVNILISMDKDADWKNYLKYINIDLKFVEEQRLNLLSK
ncbi:hypothetical protein Tco_1318344 [Tanacetum coccineum]